MSSKARRLAGGDAHEVAPYLLDGTPAPHAAARPAAERSGQGSEPEGSDGALRGEHQARVAALERDAFATGYAQGERAGLEAGHTRAEAMLRRLAETLDELTSLRERLARHTERQLVELSLAIAKRILRRETLLDADLVVAMARVALERLGETAEATIRLNPEDYAQAAQRHGDGWAGSKVRVVPDGAISRGGCAVESDFGTIDAGVDAQFDEVMRALIGNVSEHRHVRATAA